MDLGFNIQKTNLGIRICILKIPSVPMFSQNGQRLVLDINLGRLPNYVQYFGSNVVEGVGESWVEVEMSWVEVDGAGWRYVYSLVILFDDIFKNLSLVVSYTPVMLHSQWHY